MNTVLRPIRFFSEHLRTRERIRRECAESQLAERIVSLRSINDKLDYILSIIAPDVDANPFRCPWCGSVIPEGSNFCGYCRYEIQSSRKEGRS